MPPDDNPMHVLALDHERTKSRVLVLEASQKALESDIGLVRQDLRDTNTKLDAINKSLSDVVTESLNAMPKWGVDAQDRSNRTINLLVGFAAATFSAAVMLGIALVQAGHL